MKHFKTLVLALAAVAFPAAAQVVLYENDNFRGRTLQADKAIQNFERSGFNDRASSVVVFKDRWEVCEDAKYAGRCVVLRPGRYPSLASMGLNDRLSSVRKVGGNDRVDDHRYAPPQPQQQMPVYDNRRRNNERLYEANVTSVRAVVGPTEQRCWIEQEQVGNSNSQDALIGAILGSVIGYQANGKRTQDVRRCANVPSQARPDFYDVTYKYKGVEHRMQTVNPPGPTVSVNSRGEPRA